MERIGSVTCERWSEKSCVVWYLIRIIKLPLNKT